MDAGRGRDHRRCARARRSRRCIDLTARFDRLTLTPETLAFTAAEIDAEIASVAPEDRAALELAADRIRAYHARQMPRGRAAGPTPAGATLGWRWTPVVGGGALRAGRHWPPTPPRS